MKRTWTIRPSRTGWDTEFAGEPVASVERVGAGFRWCARLPGGQLADGTAATLSEAKAAAERFLAPLDPPGADDDDEPDDADATPLQDIPRYELGESGA